MDPHDKTRPFARIDCEDLRNALPCISGGAFKIWAAYLVRANADGVAWPGIETLARDTGLSRSQASRLRNKLVDDGWLLSAGTSRGARGTFGSPCFRPVIPQNDRTAKMAHGENAVRQESDSPHRKNSAHRTAKMAHEVDTSKKNPSEVDRSAGAFHARGSKFKTAKPLSIDSGEPGKFDEVIV